MTGTIGLCVRDVRCNSLPGRYDAFWQDFSGVADLARLISAGSGNSDVGFSGNSDAQDSANSGRVEQTPSGHTLAALSSEGRDDRDIQTARNPGSATG